MPKKVKGGFKKDFKHEKHGYGGKDKNNRGYSGEKRVAGKIAVNNFPGTIQQLKQWIKSMFNGTFDTFDAKDKMNHIEIICYNDDLKDKLLGLNNSNYANTQVLFTEKDKIDEKMKKTPTQMVDEILKEYFNKETNYVDLSNIEDKLKQKGYQKHVDLMFQSKIIQQLKDKYPNTAGIGYNNNNLTSLSIFKELERSLPQLVALNLMNNQIKDVQQLDFIKNIPLEVLSLNNNMIIQQREFQLKIVTYFHNLVLLNQEQYTGQQYFPVTSRQKVPPLKIALTTDYALYKVVLNFLTQYYQSVDNRSDQLMQCYAPNSILTVTLNGSSSFINGLQNYNRSHAQSISKNEYTSRMFVGQLNITNFLRDKFKPVGHGMKKMAFDITMWTIDGQTVLNVVSYGQLTHPRETINYHTTFLILFDPQSLQLKQILNQQIHLFQKRDNFSIVQPSVDARQSIEKLENLAQQQNLNMAMIVFPLAKNTNFDHDLTLRKLSVMAEVMTNANKNQMQVQFNQVHAVCELYNYDMNMMGADCGGRFNNNFVQFMQACIEMCQQKGML